MRDKLGRFIEGGEGYWKGKKRPNMTGEEHPQWNGGRTVQHGYMSIRVGKRYVYEHRYVLEKSLGRKLKRSECVHHKNGDRLDNRIENLEIIENAIHSKLHGATREKRFCSKHPDRVHYAKGLCKSCYNISLGE